MTQRLALALGLGLALAGGACTFNTPGAGAPAPPASATSGGATVGSALPPPDDPVVPGESGTEVETFVGELSGPPASVRLPEDPSWTKPGQSPSVQQRDIEACYRFATSQVERDAQIDSDRLQNREDRNDVFGLTTFSRRVDYYSERRRRGNLFDNCMRSKGYSRT